MLATINGKQVWVSPDGAGALGDHIDHCTRLLRSQHPHAEINLVVYPIKEAAYQVGHVLVPASDHRAALEAFRKMRAMHPCLPVNMEIEADDMVNEVILGRFHILSSGSVQVSAVA